MTRFKKYVTLTAALMLGASVAGSSVAAEKETARSKPAESRKAEHASLHTISGTVSAVTPGAKTLEVAVPRKKADKLVVGVSVTDRTVIREGKASKSLGDLKVGDHVWMKFERASSGDIATMIVIKPEKKRS